MDIKDFILKFSSQFEVTSFEHFKPETKFRELEEWDSMLTLSVIAMADEEYDVRLKGNDIRNAETIEELFDIIKKKSKE